MDWLIYLVMRGPHRGQASQPGLCQHDLLPIAPPLELLGALRLRGLTPAARRWHRVAKAETLKHAWMSSREGGRVGGGCCPNGFLGLSLNDRTRLQQKNFFGPKPAQAVSSYCFSHQPKKFFYCSLDRTTYSNSDIVG